MRLAQQKIQFFFCLSTYLVNFFFETLLKHLIGFVQDDSLKS